VFGAEPYGNYNRIMLSAVLCGEKTTADIVINEGCRAVWWVSAIDGTK